MEKMEKIVDVIVRMDDNGLRVFLDVYKEALLELKDDYKSFAGWYCYARDKGDVHRCKELEAKMEKVRQKKSEYETYVSYIESTAYDADLKREACEVFRASKGTKGRRK